MSNWNAETIRTLVPELETHLSQLKQIFISEYKDFPLPINNGLLAGRAGCILVQSILSEIYKEDKEVIKREIDNHIELLIGLIEKEPNCPITYCNGLAGIGWLFCYLSDKAIIETDIDEFLSDLDEILEIELERLINEADFDILHGALGLGLYFLKRNRMQKVERIILSLDTSAEKFGEGLAWRQAIKYQGEGENFIYNLGLAHGNIGIAYFLYKCLDKEVVSKKAMELLVRNLSFYRSVMQDWSKEGCYFPAVIYRPNGDQPGHSRLSWCYGDLGIFYIQLLVAIRINDHSQVEFVTECLRKTVTRTEVENSGVVDSCFCHGAAGAAYIYLKIFAISNDPVFLTASRFWLNKAFLLSTDGNGNATYSFAGSDQRQFTADILTGYGGVYLTYLAFLHPHADNSWDEVLFLS